MSNKQARLLEIVLYILQCTICYDSQMHSATVSVAGVGLLSPFFDENDEGYKG